MDPSPPNPSSLPTESTHDNSARRLPIRTYHCRCCSHLLLASTLDILASSTQSSGGLARRKDPALDHALIVPIPARRRGSPSSSAGSEIYTILLSTTLPDTKPVVVRRDDGFERRICLRCGRCRVVVGYFLDQHHHRRRNAPHKKPLKTGFREDDDGEEEEKEEEEVVEIEGDEDGETDRVAYILPGALVGTEDITPPDGEGGEQGGRGGGGVDLPIRKNEILQQFEEEWLDWTA